MSRKLECARHATRCTASSHVALLVMPVSIGPVALPRLGYHPLHRSHVAAPQNRRCACCVRVVCSKFNRQVLRIVLQAELIVGARQLGSRSQLRVNRQQAVLCLLVWEHACYGRCRVLKPARSVCRVVVRSLLWRFS
jgi:hypothetical protein